MAPATINLVASVIPGRKGTNLVQAALQPASTSSGLLVPDLSQAMSRMSRTKRTLDFEMYKYMILLLMLTGVFVKATSDKEHCVQEGRLTRCVGIFKDEHFPSSVYETKNLLIVHSDLSKVSSQVMCRFLLLERFQIHNCTLPSPASATYTCLKLKDLLITHSNFTEEHASLIGYNSVSETLSLQGNNLSKIPSKLINRLPDVQNINLDDNNIEDVDDATLRNLRTVTKHWTLKRNVICIRRQFRFRLYSQEQVESSQDHIITRALQIAILKQMFLCEACYTNEDVAQCLKNTEMGSKDSTKQTTIFKLNFIIGVLVILVIFLSVALIAMCCIRNRRRSTDPYNVSYVEQGSSVSDLQENASLDKCILTLKNEFKDHQTPERNDSNTVAPLE